MGVFNTPNMSHEARKVASFVTKTHNIVSDEATNEVVSWLQGGECFAIKDQHRFQTEILPSFFKHNNLSSFIRQLNTYGFRKTLPEFLNFKTDSEYIIFAHEHFKQNRTDLHHLITRKRTGKRKLTQADQDEVGLMGHTH